MWEIGLVDDVVYPDDKTVEDTVALKPEVSPHVVVKHLAWFGGHTLFPELEIPVIMVSRF